MSWFKRQKPVRIVTDVEGLARLVDYLSRDSLTAMSQGVYLRSCPSIFEEGFFHVWLEPYQVKKLEKYYVPTDLQRMFGPQRKRDA